MGKEHPQALIYPLTVASKSASFARRTAAESILEQMEAFAPQLVKQAKLVSEELIRVAILWHEMWHEALEEVILCVYLYIRMYAHLCVSIHIYTYIHTHTCKKRKRERERVYKNMFVCVVLCINCKCMT